MKFISLGAGMILSTMLLACQYNAPSTTSVSSSESTPTASAEELTGTWHIESIGERPVIDHSPARIQFLADGRINGNASCNRFSGTYSVVDGKLAISRSLIATKMMCLPALMQQEQDLFEVLPGAVSGTFDNGMITLSDEQNAQGLKAAFVD